MSNPHAVASKCGPRPLNPDAVEAQNNFDKQFVSFCSILTRYNIKGNRGLDKPANASDAGGREQLWDQINGGDIAMLPGVFQIPLCGPQEIWENWQKKTAGQDMNYIEYPCSQS
jgi:hypothetical protein